MMSSQDFPGILHVSRSSGLPKPRGSGLSGSHWKTGDSHLPSPSPPRSSVSTLVAERGGSPVLLFTAGLLHSPSLVCLAAGRRRLRRAPASSFEAPRLALPQAHRAPVALLGPEPSEAAASDRRALETSPGAAHRKSRREEAGTELARCGTHRGRGPPPKAAGRTH